MPFNFDMKVLLTTEDTAGAMSVIMAWHKPKAKGCRLVARDMERTYLSIMPNYPNGSFGNP